MRDNSLLPHRLKWPFTEMMVDAVPDKQGVYALWNDDGIFYIGLADSPGGLRAEFERYCREEDPTRISEIHDFQFEISHTPQSRHRELLQEFKRLHGAYPLFNRTE